MRCALLMFFLMKRCVKKKFLLFSGSCASVNCGSLRVLEAAFFFFPSPFFISQGVVECRKSDGLFAAFRGQYNYSFWTSASQDPETSSG